VVAVGSYQLATCIWNVTSLSRPLPATCRTGQTHLDGGITFTADRTASGSARVLPDLLYHSG